MRQIEQRLHAVELSRPAQLHSLFPSSEMSNTLRQRSGNMLNAQRVRVAGSLECRAFLSPRFRLRSYRPFAQIRPQAIEDFLQIRIGPRDGSARQRPRQITILAVRWTALRYMKLPIRARWNRLQLLRRGRLVHHSHLRLRVGVLAHRRAIAQPGKAIRAQLNHLRSKRKGTLHHRPPMLES